jgi:methionyl aminopeptidase
MLTFGVNNDIEHTFLVTETGVEVLTARLPNSPGGPVPMPAAENGTNSTS